MTYTPPELAPGSYADGAQLESITDQLVVLSSPVEATVATLQTTTSTSFVDLATAGPAQTVTVGPSGIVKITVTCQLFNSGGNYCIMSFAGSGANTVAAVDTSALELSGVTPHRGSAVKLLTGLTPGVTTFTAKYRVTAGTGTFVDRDIIVETY